jgi:hypothetical protein
LIAYLLCPEETLCVYGLDKDVEFLRGEDINKINKIQDQTNGIDFSREKVEHAHICCFKGFTKHKCLLCTCILMIIYSLIISTIITTVLSAILLMTFGKKEKRICSPI